MEQQPSLFQDTESPQVEPVDTDAIAERIAINARPVEYEDRTSEAAADQGWGPVEHHHTPISPRAAGSAERVRPFRGTVRGDSEIDGNRTPSGHESNWRISTEEREVGRVSLAAARRALHTKRDK